MNNNLLFIRFNSFCVRHTAGPADFILFAVEEVLGTLSDIYKLFYTHITTVDWMGGRELVYANRKIPEKRVHKGRVKLFFDKWKNRMAIGGVSILLLGGSVVYGCNTKPQKEEVQKKQTEQVQKPVVKEEVKAEKCYSKEEQKELDKQLLDAAGNADIEKVKELLDKGADVNAREDISERTPLMVAIWDHSSDERNEAEEARRLEIVELLIEKGANVNSRSTNGANALTWACIEERIEIARTLLEHGSETGVIKYMDPLWYSRAVRNKEMVKLIKEYDQ